MNVEVPKGQPAIAGANDLFRRIQGSIHSGVKGEIPLIEKEITGPNLIVD
jgi:hypothetical protein